MATVTKTPSGTFKVQIRKVGIPAITKTYKTKADAQKWARLIESELDRGIFINRQEADKVTVGELIDRYIQEVTPLKRSAIKDKCRMLYLNKEAFWPLYSQPATKQTYCRLPRQTIS